MARLPATCLDRPTKQVVQTSCFLQIFFVASSCPLRGCCRGLPGSSLPGAGPGHKRHSRVGAPDVSADSASWGRGGSSGSSLCRVGGCEGHRGSAGGTCTLRRLCGVHRRRSCPSVRGESTGAAPEVGLAVVAPVVVAVQPCNTCCAIRWALEWCACAPCTAFAEARLG